MSKAEHKDWLWAYHKLRSLSVGRTSSAFLATLYHLRGDTGLFYCEGGLRKSRLVRDDPH
ncbi:hypothetical protein [Pseudomonas panipatensis]|uniref:Uncharacterized protein n=1 Tax=Pseudomonas panipatensis TaxID=428992 RepID=A0A1G8I8D0_9PSED|nr:hypothetical protein [Pseudomonas panipatensis]SDI14810.1 hypothetical protein SAMN05216272_10677 [Pseudomonas panipatensis]SMP75866.1 hypothetical protein SAMN06295951_11435 [Pseudomonas panipatensis]